MQKKDRPEAVCVSVFDESGFYFVVNESVSNVQVFP